MMLVRCIEGARRPSVVTLPVDEGTIFGIYLLEDVLESESGLRATVLRLDGVAPPPQSVLVLNLEVVRSASTNGHQFQVRAVGRKVTVELTRTDRRSRATRNGEIKPGTRVEVSAGAWKRFDFVLQLHSGGAADASASAASGNKSAGALVAERGALWRIPTGGTLAKNGIKALKEWLKGMGARLGLSATTTRFLIMGLVFLLVAGLAWYQQYSRAQDAEFKAKQAGDTLARAEAARKASLDGEQACLAERQVLVQKLGKEEEALRLKAEAALSISAALGVAVDEGGPLYGGEAVRDLDTSHQKSTLSAVVTAMQEWKAGPPEVRGCLDLAGLLPTDLPRYALVWHPDLKMVCPDASAVVTLDGLDLMGRWGLSKRVAKEFGVEDPALSGVDARTYPRWSLQTTLSALRNVQQSLLQYDGRGRPSTGPSESQLWSLAILGAYERMPSPAEGAMDLNAALCVQGILDAQVAEGKTAVPGEPLLPPIAAILNGDQKLTLTPTPGCPWPTGALDDGIRAAFRAVALLAVTDTPPPAPQ